MITYTLIGLLAGFLGARANDLGSIAGYQHLASILTGAMLIFIGLRSVFSKGKGLSGQLPRGLLAKFIAWVAQASNKFTFFGYSPQALFLGLLTGLLPCGWLYSFALVAAASGSPRGGMLTMLVFWAGSVPALFVFGSATKIVASSLGKYAPQLTATLLICAGLYSVFNRGHHHHDHSQHSQHEQSNKIDHHKDHSETNTSNHSATH
jgi:sulfite exporter TauE/SafE